MYFTHVNMKGVKEGGYPGTYEPIISVDKPPIQTPKIEPAFSIYLLLTRSFTRAVVCLRFVAYALVDLAAFLEP